MLFSFDTYGGTYISLCFKRKFPGLLWKTNLPNNYLFKVSRKKQQSLSRKFSPKLLWTLHGCFMRVAGRKRYRENSGKTCGRV